MRQAPNLANCSSVGNHQNVPIPLTREVVTAPCSRHAAVRKWRGEHIFQDLKEKGIYAHPASWKVMAEEAPDAYKNVSQVVNVTHGAGISLKVVKLLPLGVVKG